MHDPWAHRGGLFGTEAVRGETALTVRLKEHVCATDELAELLGVSGNVGVALRRALPMRRLSIEERERWQGCRRHKEHVCAVCWHRARAYILTLWDGRGRGGHRLAQ